MTDPGPRLGGVRPRLDRHRPKVGRVRLRSPRRSQQVARLRSASKVFGPRSGEFGPNSDEFDPAWPDMLKVWPCIQRMCAALVPQRFSSNAAYRLFDSGVRSRGRLLKRDRGPSRGKLAACMHPLTIHSVALLRPVYSSGPQKDPGSTGLLESAPSPRKASGPLWRSNLTPSTVAEGAVACGPPPVAVLHWDRLGCQL